MRPVPSHIKLKVVFLCTYYARLRVLVLWLWKIRVQLDPLCHTATDRVHRVELVAGPELLHVLRDEVRAGPRCRSGWRRTSLIPRHLHEQVVNLRGQQYDDKG